MNHSRKVQIVSVLALMVSAMALFISYTTLSTQLEVSHSTAVEKTSWNVGFNNIHDVSAATEVASFTNSPVVEQANNQKVVFSSKLLQPGASVSFKIDVVNNGTFDAKVSSIEVTGIDDSIKDYVTCTVTGINVDDIVARKNDTDTDEIKNVTITLTYNPTLEEQVVPEQYLGRDISTTIGVLINFIKQ